MAKPKATTWQDQLARYKRPDGTYRVEDALRWAEQNKDSALGRKLEWNNAKAGREFRLWQLRELTVKIFIEYEGRTTQRFLSLSFDRGKPGGGYRDIRDVMADNSLLAMAMRDALAELHRIHEKFRIVKALDPVWDAVASVRKRLEEKHPRIAETLPEEHIGRPSDTLAA